MRDVTIPNSITSEDSTSEKHPNVDRRSLNNRPNRNHNTHHPHEPKTTKFIPDCSLRKRTDCFTGNVDRDNLCQNGLESGLFLGPGGIDIQHR